MKAAAMKIEQELILPDGRKVVRYDPPMDARGLAENLVCFNADGSVRWKKAPSHPSGQLNFFTGVRLEGDKLFANTWGSYMIEIAPLTGEESNPKFTK
jgi:hypothetical protein